MNTSRKQKYATKSCVFNCLSLFIRCTSFSVNAQNEPLQLKYFGTAGWEISDGNITVSIDSSITRMKLGTGPGVSAEDTRKTVLCSDVLISDTLLIDN